MKHHAQCLSFQNDDCEDRFLYIILESPDSGGFKFLVNGKEFNHQGFHFLLPESAQNKIGPDQREHYFLVG